MDAITPENLAQVQAIRAESAAAVAAETDTAADTAVAEPVVETADVAVVPAAEDVAGTAAEQTDAAETPENTGESATTVIAAPENFEDLLQSVPSDETLLARNARIPQSSKDEIVNLAKTAREARASVDRVGGDAGIDILEPVAKLLYTAEPKDDDVIRAMGSMMRTNSQATVKFMIDSTAGLLFNKGTDNASKQLAGAGDRLLAHRFGEGVTADKIEKYVLLERGGMIDLNRDLDALGFDGSRFVETQQQQIANQTAEIAELKKLVENPDLIPANTQTRAVSDFDAELDRQLSEGIDPFRESVRWGADDFRTRTVKGEILAQLRAAPEYKEALAFVKKNGGLKEGDSIPFTISRNLTLLTNMGKSRFFSTAIGINKESANHTATSRNAEVAEKVKAPTQPKPAALTEVQPDVKLSHLFGSKIAGELQKIRDETREAGAG